MERCPSVLRLVSDEEDSCQELPSTSNESPSNCKQFEISGSCQPRVQHSVKEERLLYLVAVSKIRKLGKKLNLSDECINTATVYMHKLHSHQSFKEYSVNSVASATLDLATKFTEYDDQRTLHSILRNARICFQPDEPALDVTSQLFINTRDEVLRYESELLISLELKVRVETPHEYVKEICESVGVGEDLAAASLFLADVSLRLTSLIGRLNAKVVACACIHSACKWTHCKIKPRTEDREWFYFVEQTLTKEYLNNLAEELLKVLQTIPEKIRHKILAKPIAASSSSISDPVAKRARKDIKE